MSESNLTPRPQALGPSAKLLAALLSVTLLWGWFLPWISGHPRVKQRLDFLDSRGIDPSAMFYTELEVMDEILDRVESRKRPTTAGRQR